MKKSMRRKMGHYNLGHTITDATDVQYRGPNEPSTQQETRVSSINTNSNNVGMTMSSDKMRLSRRTGITLDVGIVLISLLWIVIIELGFFPQKQRGFTCGDPLISKQYLGETIRATTLVISVLLVYFVIWAIEGIFYSPRGLKDSRMKKSARIAAKWFWKFTCGIFFGYILLDAIKIFTVEKRPHFLQTCQPNTAINCTIGEFIPEYKCTQTNISFIESKELTKSFPSGHACIATYSGFFLAWYFQCRVPKLQSKLMLLFLQTTVLVWSVFCSVSRVTDNRHHWWDVLVGSLLGIIFATFSCSVLCRNFQERRKLITPITSEDYENAPVICVKGLLSDSTGKDEVSLQSGPASPS